MKGLDVEAISPLLKQIRDRVSKKSIKTTSKEKKRLQNIRAAIKNIKRKNSGK